MTTFSDQALLNIHHRKLENPSASLSLSSTKQTLSLRFDSKDTIIDVAYEGPVDPWLNILCQVITGMTLNTALNFGWPELEKIYKDDQLFWDLRTEQNEEIFFTPFELLKGVLDIFRGREYLYQESSPLICRCFGIRESDVLEHLKTETTPTLETLSGKTKAGMGCRSCVPQLSQLLAVHSPKNKSRYYKDRPVVDWLLDIDNALKNFFEGHGWNLEVNSLKGNQALITFDKEVTQIEEEEMALNLQRFLGEAVDEDLGFFLVFIRDEQRLKKMR